MARPVKKGIDYFPKDVSFYEDFKIIELINEYGPAGVIVYEVILCMIYKNGYYIEVALDKLALAVARCIGNRWIKKDFALQVILYCADIGLFDKDLLSQSVITSVGVQKRYAEVTVRSKAHKDRFWLLEKNQESRDVFSDAENSVFATETGVFAAKTQVNAAEIPINKSKLNKSKLNNNNSDWLSKFEDAFCRPITQVELFKLSDALNEFGEDMLLYALDIAVTSNAINIRYIEGIMNNWRTNHIDTLQKALLDSKNHKSKQGAGFTPSQIVLPKDFDENKNRKISTEQISEEELAALKKRMQDLESKRS